MSSSLLIVALFKIETNLHILISLFHLLFMTFDVHAIVSGGFATVHPNNKLTINAVEAAPLADFSLEVSTRLF